MDISLVSRSIKWYQKIGFQFSVLLFVFSAIVLFALGAHSKLLFDLGLLRADEMPLTQAEQVAGAVESQLDGIRANVQMVVDSLDERLEPNTLAQTVLRNRTDAIHVALFSADGARAWSWTAAGAREYPSARIQHEPFFVTAMRGDQYIGQPFVLDNLSVFEWSFPLIDSEENVLGVLYLLVNMERIAATLERVPHAAFIVDHTGDVSLERNGRVSEGGRMQAHPVIEAHRNNVGGVVSFTDEQGRRMLGAWERLVPTSWLLVYEMPLRSVYEEFVFSLILLGVLFVTLIILVGYVAIYFYREISVPTSHIQQTLAAFAEGDMKARAKVVRNNELGMLGRTFNTLAERIADEPNRLRGEVERRTEELRAANTKLQKLVREVQENATQVLNKERELVEANESLGKLNRELERVGNALRKREQELTAANKRLEEIDSTKSEFVSVAAHQLRTPLTGIRWALKGLANKEFGDLSHDQLGAIQNGLTAAETAINLINDLLDIARIEEGRYGFHFEIAPLAPVLAKVIERQKRRADKKGVELVPATMAKDMCVKQDPERLGIAIENAVDNAIKYTPPKGSVTMHVDIKESRVEVHVTDTGIGIPLDQQHRLFSKFFRAPNAMLMQTSGTGLGLYLMQNIVKRHKGSVWVKSAENKGTTMTFSFPIVPCESEHSSDSNEGTEAEDSNEASLSAVLNESSI